MSELSDILKQIDTRPAMDKIIEAYHAQGYIGRFPTTLRTEATPTSIVFKAAYYSWFMLHGRRPGKQPPIDAIRDWVQRYGIPRNEWAVAKKIAREGTKGNDFLTPIVPEISAEISKQVISKLKIF